MRQVKLTNRRLNYLIKDEAKASAEYGMLALKLPAYRRGFDTLAEDERKHRRFLQKIKSGRKQ